MATIQTGKTLNPNIYAVLAVLEPFKGSYAATLAGTTRATFTVGGVAYTVTGTGFALLGGKLSAGTITGITTASNSLGQFRITELGLSVASLNAAAAAERSNPFALESLLSASNHSFVGTKGNNLFSQLNVSLTGTNKWTLDDGNDTATGGTGVDSFFGGNGADVISGNNGNDRMRGEAGNDTVNGDGGVDNLYGGSGSDVLKGGTGNDRLYGGTEDSLANTLNGEAGNDSLIGGKGADLLNGGSESDKLYGGLGADRLNGDSENDRLDGGADSDSLNGGTGRDSLIGGAGRDTLTGGADADVFVLNKRAHLGTSLATADQITDFQVGVDDILLKGLDLDWIGTRGFSSSTSVAQVRWEASSTSLQIDVDGNNTIDHVIDLQSGITLRESDLIL